MQIVNGPIKCTLCSARSAKTAKCRRRGMRRWGRSWVPTLVLVQTVHKHLSTSFSSKCFPAPEGLSVILCSFLSVLVLLLFFSFHKTNWALKCYDIVFYLVTCFFLSFVCGVLLSHMFRRFEYCFMYFVLNML